MALVEAGFAASASAFFLASLARRLRSASRLPEATRPGFFSVAGFVFGGSVVTRTGVVAGAGVSSGIVSSGCVAIVYIGVSKPSKFLQGSCQVPSRFLPHDSVLNQLHQSPRVGSLCCHCWGVWEVVVVVVVCRVGSSSLTQVQVQV